MLRPKKEHYRKGQGLVERVKKADWYFMDVDDKGKEYKNYLILDVKEDVDLIINTIIAQYGVTSDKGIREALGISNHNNYTDYFKKGKKPIPYHVMKKLAKAFDIEISFTPTKGKYDIKKNGQYIFIKRNFGFQFSINFNVDNFLDYQVHIHDDINNRKFRHIFVWKYIVQALHDYYESGLPKNLKLQAMYHDFEHKFITRDPSIFYDYYETKDKAMPFPKQENTLDDKQEVEFDIQEGDD